MKKVQVVVMVCAFLFYLTKGNAQITFDTSLNYNNNLDFAYSVQFNDDSNYFVFGEGFDLQTGLQRPLLLYKANQKGNVLALNVIAVDSIYLYPGLSGSLVQTHDGNFAGGGSVVTVYSKSYGALVKYNSTPDTLFFKKYGYSDYDFFNNNIETSDHGFGLVGVSSTYDSTTQLYNDDIWLVKTDSAGNLQAQATYGGAEDDDAIVISEIPSKRLLIGGVKKFSATNYTPWMIITDFNGNLIKQKELNNSQNFFCGGGFIRPSNDGRYIYQGYYDTLINLDNYPCASYIGLMDTNFNFQWRTFYSDSGLNSIYNVRQLADSTIVFCGFRQSNYYGWMGKLDKNGNKLWEREFKHGNSTFNIFADFQQTPWDKGFILTGSTVDNYNQNIWLVKLDSNGMLLPDTVNTGAFEVSNEQLNMEMFPNPASSQITFQYNLPASVQAGELVISDLIGRTMTVILLNDASHLINLNVTNWPAGMYLCTIKAGNVSILSKKLMVQK